MKLIELADAFANITCDSTLITVDNIMITCDSTVMGNISKSFSAIPRIMPNLGETLIVKLRNELTNVEFEASHSWNYTNNYFTVNLLDTFYLPNEKYELNIYRNGTIIYNNKLMTVSYGQSIQDYTSTEITPTQKLIF